MRYRKLPVEIVVEAFKWTGGPDQEEDPDWIIEAMHSGIVFFRHDGTPDVELGIRHLEGIVTANRGDYIIHANNGSLSVYKSDIFEKRYEKVNNTI